MRKLEEEQMQVVLVNGGLNTIVGKKSLSQMALLVKDNIEVYRMRSLRQMFVRAMYYQQNEEIVALILKP